MNAVLGTKDKRRLDAANGGIGHELVYYEAQWR